MFSCYLFDAVFEDQDSIRKHVENCGKEKKKPAQNPLKTPTKPQKMSTNSNHWKTKFIRVTPQTIAQKKMLKIGDISCEKSYKVCFICGEKFETPMAFEHHFITVHSEKNYNCKYCGKIFTQPGSVKRHERIHTDEKPFACKNCHYKTADLANLKKHERTHNEKPSVFLSHKDTNVNVIAKTEKLEASFEKLSEFSIEFKDNSFKEQPNSLDLKAHKEYRAVENHIPLHEGKVYVHEQMSDSEHSIQKENNLFSCYLCDAGFENEEGTYKKTY